MSQTIDELAKAYAVSPRQIGQVLSQLGILDATRAPHKKPPKVQYITHGIVKAIDDGQGSIVSYEFDIAPLKDEFEKLLAQVRCDERRHKQTSTHLLFDGLEKIASLLQTIDDAEESPGLQQARDEIDRLRSYLLDTDVELALPLDESGKEVLERLSNWRREEAARQDKPAFTIFGNRVLHYLAYYRPHDEEELLAIKGIGEKKAAAYGVDLLRLITKT